MIKRFCVCSEIVKYLNWFFLRILRLNGKIKVHQGLYSVLQFGPLHISIRFFIHSSYHCLAGYSFLAANIFSLVGIIKYNFKHACLQSIYLTFLLVLKIINQQFKIIIFLYSILFFTDLSSWISLPTYGDGVRPRSKAAGDWFEKRLSQNVSFNIDHAINCLYHPKLLSNLKVSLFHCSLIWALE